MAAFGLGRTSFIQVMLLAVVGLVMLVVATVHRHSVEYALSQRTKTEIAQPRTCVVVRRLGASSLFE